MRITLRGLAVESDWRDEALRTNLWLIPVIESVAGMALFAVTLSIDEAAAHGSLRLPSWVISGSPDAARQILSSLAGSIITVVGVVFSIMIVTLTLASQQFGPRMLRTFIRDRGAQVTLGTFVATFFYAMRYASGVQAGAVGLAIRPRGERRIPLLRSSGNPVTRRRRSPIHALSPGPPPWPPSSRSSPSPWAASRGTAPGRSTGHRRGHPALPMAGPQTWRAG